MVHTGCSYRFRHPHRPRGRCGLPLAPRGGEHCYWHTDPKLRPSEGCGKALAALVAHEHWLEGARLDHADLRGLDLTCANLPHADLRDARLEGAQLSGARLDAARLEAAKLTKASLVRASLRLATLHLADLRGAQLEWADLSGASLVGTRLDGAYLYSVAWSKRTAVDAVDWGRLGEYVDGHFARASNAFRNIAMHFEELSDHDKADRFHFLQMSAKHLDAIGAKGVPTGGVVRRAAAWLRGVWPPKRLANTLMWSVHRKVWGYGSRPRWVFVTMLATLVLFAGVYWLLGTTRGGGGGEISHSLLDACDVSLVSFATLGYGTRTGAGSLGEFIGGFEALLGSFLVGAFIVALATKYVRR